MTQRNVHSKRRKDFKELQERKRANEVPRFMQSSPRGSEEMSSLLRDVRRLERQGIDIDANQARLELASALVDLGERAGLPDPHDIGAVYEEVMT